MGRSRRGLQSPKKELNLWVLSHPGRPLPAVRSWRQSLVFDPRACSRNEPTGTRRRHGNHHHHPKGLSNSHSNGHRHRHNPPPPPTTPPSRQSWKRHARCNRQPAPSATVTSTTTANFAATKLPPRGQPTTFPKRFHNRDFEVVQCLDPPKVISLPRSRRTPASRSGNATSARSRRCCGGHHLHF